MFEDTNGVIKIRKSKDRNYNGQKKKDKNFLQLTMQKTKDRKRCTCIHLNCWDHDIARCFKLFVVFASIGNNNMAAPKILGKRNKYFLLKKFFSDEIQPGFNHHWIVL